MATQDSSIRSDFYVYALFRETGLPFYVGKGKGHRWTQHERDARNGARGYKATIIRSMQTRGVKVIKVKLHDGLTEAVAYAYEIALIRAIGWGDKGVLLNRTDGGDGSPGVRGRKHSLETRAKMSAAAIGRPMAPETQAKLRAANLGSKHSASHVEKQAAALRGQKKSPEAIAKSAAARRGAKRTAESRARMAAAKLGRKQPPEHTAKIAAANRGRKRSAEICAKISAAKRGRSNSLRGKKQSPEAIANRVASRLANTERRRAEAMTLTA